MPGYTVHRCVYCVLEYYTDFTDIEPGNHSWIAESDGHFCANGCAEHGASWAEHTMVEGVCQNCGTGCQHESITLDEESITDVDGEPVVITLTDDGYYATEQTIDLDDAVNIPYTDIEFTVPAVSYTRDISAYTGSNWGTLSASTSTTMRQQLSLPSLL